MDNEKPHEEKYMGRRENMEKQYMGVLNAMERFERHSMLSTHADIAYLASQLELAPIPPEAKKPFYAAMEAFYRIQAAQGEENQGLAKLADFYASKLETPDKPKMADYAGKKPEKPKKH